MPEERKKTPVKDIFVIKEGTGDKKYWRNVGCAFVNDDGSINLKLYMFPGLSLQARDRQEKP
jgi:uncharacterized protein YhfF